MLILCSDGLTSNHLLQKAKTATQGCRTAALVVTADPVYKEKNYHVPRCMKELESLGLCVTIFDLDRHPADLLINYDVVEFIGGNPYYLLHVLRTANCVNILKDFITNKILIGWSAAVFVFGPTLALVDQYTPEMNEVGLTDLSGISLTDCVVLPHYSKFCKKLDSFEEKCRAFESEYQVNVIRLNDGDGIFLNGKIIEVCNH